LLPLDAGSTTRTADLGFDLEAVSTYREKADSPTSISNSDNGDDMGLYEAGVPESSPAPALRLKEMGEFDSLLDSQVVFNSVDENQDRNIRRRKISFAKHMRMSLVASVMNSSRPSITNRKSLFIRPSRRMSFLEELPIPETLQVTASFPQPEQTITEENVMLQDMCPLERVVSDEGILTVVLSFFQEHELLRIASLVCSLWADVATNAHANLMLKSVGCLTLSSDTNYDSDDELCDDQALSESKSIPGLLERPWSYLTSNFPWACFLSEGAFKKVYKVFNENLQVEEAVSVM
jgi:hypothetical protein